MEDRAATYTTLAMSDAEVFAALCALPVSFRFEVERRQERGPDPFLTNAVWPTPVAMSDEERARREEHERAIMDSVQERTWWRIGLNNDPDGGGPGFYGRGDTLAAAWSQVRHQIASFTEVL